MSMTPSHNRESARDNLGDNYEYKEPLISRNEETEHSLDVRNGQKNELSDKNKAIDDAESHMKERVRFHFQSYVNKNQKKKYRKTTVTIKPAVLEAGLHILLVIVITTQVSS